LWRIRNEHLQICACFLRHVCLSVCLSACNNSKSAARVSIKFGSVELYQNLLTVYNFV
jgi:hypothetical protein